ncbi:MAG: HepT-like ribonuclease domain-containing protein [Minisyncoccota bacterium]
MQKDVDIYLRDIVESCKLIIKNTDVISLDEFRANTTLQDAVIRRFEIIGEAVKHVPETLRIKYPDVAWQEAAGFRDVLIHDYPEIIIDDVYHTAKHDLPGFRAQIAKILKELQEEGD